MSYRLTDAGIFFWDIVSLKLILAEVALTGRLRSVVKVELEDDFGSIDSETHNDIRIHRIVGYRLTMKFG